MRNVILLGTLVSLVIFFGCTSPDENPNWNPQEDYPSWTADAAFYYEPTSELKPQEYAGNRIPIYYTREMQFFVKHPNGKQPEVRPRTSVWASDNDGANWSRDGFYGLDQKYYLFQAARDGRYWIRLVGPGQPASDVPPGQPNAIYIVDSFAPAISVQVTPSPWIESEKDTCMPRMFRPGEVVTLSWQVADNNLKAGTVELGTCFAKFPNNLVWSRYPKTLPANGSIRIRIPEEAANQAGLRFRIIAQDKAGNVGIGMTPILNVAQTVNPETKQYAAAPQTHYMKDVKPIESIPQAKPNVKFVTAAPIETAADVAAKPKPSYLTPTAIKPIRAADPTPPNGAEIRRQIELAEGKTPAGHDAMTIPDEVRDLMRPVRFGSNNGAESAIIPRTDSMMATRTPTIVNPEPLVRPEHAADVTPTIRPVKPVETAAPETPADPMKITPKETAETVEAPEELLKTVRVTPREDNGLTEAVTPVEPTEATAAADVTAAKPAEKSPEAPVEIEEMGDLEIVMLDEPKSKTLASEPAAEAKPASTPTAPSLDKEDLVDVPVAVKPAVESPVEKPVIRIPEVEQLPAPKKVTPVTIVELESEAPAPAAAPITKETATTVETPAEAFSDDEVLEFHLIDDTNAAKPAAPKTPKAPEKTVTYEKPTKLVDVPEKVLQGWPGEGLELRGGVSRLLNWLPEGAGKYKALQLQFSSDSGKNWVRVADGLKPGRASLWTVPAVTSDHCLLRIVARDAKGKVTTLETSPAFSVSSESWDDRYKKTLNR